MRLLLVCLFGLVAWCGASSVVKRQIVDDELTELYLRLPGYIRVTPELLEQCWRCTDFDQNGFGIMPHTNETRCWSYIVCWKDRGVFRVAFERACPPGTIYNPDSGPLGIPCSPGEPDADCVPRPDTPWEIEDPGCPYQLMDPGNDRTSFGIMINGVLSFVDSCGTGGVWDQKSCSCVVRTGDCKCLVLMDFTDEIQAHGCNGGWVTSEGTAVDISVAGISGTGAAFSGFDAGANNGAHLKTWVLDGAFDNKCTKWRGYKELSVTVWIKYQGDYSGTEGILGYGDCKEQDPGFFIQLRDGVPCAGLKTMNRPLVEICATNPVPSDTWVYLALVYDRPELRFYVTTEPHLCSDAVPPPSCTPVGTATQKGCVESRNCGMQVGFTGTTKDQDEFFVGVIDEVNVYQGANFFGCP